MEIPPYEIAVRLLEELAEIEGFIADNIDECLPGVKFREYGIFDLVFDLLDVPKIYRRRLIQKWIDWDLFENIEEFVQFCQNAEHMFKNLSRN